MSDLDHARRTAMLDELHARPAPRMGVPSRALYLALKVAQDAATRDRAQEDRHRAELALTAQLSDQASGELHGGGFAVRHDSHTEVATYLAYSTSGAALRPDAGTDADLLFPPDWVTSGPARRTAAVIVDVLPLPADEAAVIDLLTTMLHADRLVAQRILDGTSVLATDFTADAQGWTRFVLLAGPQVGPGRIGRTVQRVLDLETYRGLAMLGFDRARTLGARLNAIDPQLVELVAELQDEARPDAEVLHDLLTVTAELEALAMAHDFRFGATGAYAAIVESRLSEIGGERFLGRLTLREFLARRYAPAIRTAASTQARLDRMLKRASRAGDLLRTRVEVAQQAQNAALLHSMDTRAEVQLRLQHTVEGLSVVAISYYAVGLLGYLLAPVAKSSGIDKAALMAVAIPLVVLATWLGLRWARGRITH